MSTLRWCVRRFSAFAFAVMPNQDTWRVEAEVTSSRLGRIHRGGRGGFALISLMRYGQQSRMAEREEAKSSQFGCMVSAMALTRLALKNYR